MLNVASLSSSTNNNNTNNFVLNNPNQHNTEQENSLKFMKLKQTKQAPVLNSSSASTVNSRQSLSPGRHQATANPVIIIHQNNSVSSNVDYLNNYDANNNQSHKKITTSSANSNNNNNSMESSSSFSSTVSTSSSISSSNNVETIENQSNNKEDLKYMKGYVNVLKERFTRRSLGSHAFEQFTNPTLINTNTSNVSSNDTNHNNKAIRMSINDYQRRKLQTSGVASSSKLATSQNDYQRRRSASPFTSRENIVPNRSVNSTGYVAPSIAMNSSTVVSSIVNNGSKMNAAKYSRDVCSNLVEVKSIYTKNKQKQFASSDDLSDLQQNLKNTDQLLPTSAIETYSLPSYSSMSHLSAAASSSDIIKCTYFNEINKDELPKANFVSSVKNLFEKQISSNNAVSSSHVSSSSSISPPQSFSNMNVIHSHETSRISSPVSSSTRPHRADLTPTITEDSVTKVVKSPKSYTAPQAIDHEANASITTKSSPKTTPSQSTILDTVSINCTDTSSSSVAMQQSPEQAIEHLVDRMKHNGTLVYDHNNLINSPNNLTSSTTKTQEPTTPILPKSESSPVLKTFSPILDTKVPEKPLQTLSFKERKDVFNKQNKSHTSSHKNKLSPASDNINNSNSPGSSITHKPLQKTSISNLSPSSLVPSHHKRQKIETVSPGKQLVKPIAKIEFLDIPNDSESTTDEVDLKMENKENSNETTPVMSVQERTKSINKTKFNSEDFHKPESRKITMEPTLGDTTNSSVPKDQFTQQKTSPQQKADHQKSTSGTLEKENDVTMQQSNMPTATEVLNSANEAQQAKNKLKSACQVKMKTFYGGEVIKDVKTLNLATPDPSLKKASFRLNPTCPPQPIQTHQPQSSEYFEFIGACVKLAKSNLSSSSFENSSSNINNKKSTNFRVNFTDVQETFEYPSYEFLLKEMGIDPQTDPDYQLVPGFDATPEPLTFDSFLPGGSSLSPSSSPRNDFYETHANLNFYGNGENEHSNLFDDNMNATKFTKGSFSNFKPSWHSNMNYELGSGENFDILQPINQNTSSKSHINRSNNNNNNNSALTDSFITNDILPTKEEDLKRWSTDMDSNILF